MKTTVVMFLLALALFQSSTLAQPSTLLRQETATEPAAAAATTPMTLEQRLEAMEKSLATIAERLARIETKIGTQNFPGPSTAADPSRKLDDILRKLDAMERDIDDIERKVDRN